MIKKDGSENNIGNENDSDSGSTTKTDDTKESMMQKFKQKLYSTNKQSSTTNSVAKEPQSTNCDFGFTSGRMGGFVWGATEGFTTGALMGSNISAKNMWLLGPLNQLIGFTCGGITGSIAGATLGFLSNRNHIEQVLDKYRQSGGLGNKDSKSTNQNDKKDDKDG